MPASPQSFWEVYRDTFDFLLATGRPGIPKLTLHAHFGGRPPMAAMLDSILRHRRSAERLWFARHDAVARWMLRPPPRDAAHAADRAPA